eukprot:1159161-Pelagomonas_calceolata.AAC.3
MMVHMSTVSVHSMVPQSTKEDDHDDVDVMTRKSCLGMTIVRHLETGRMDPLPAMLAHQLLLAAWLSSLQGLAACRGCMETPLPSTATEVLRGQGRDKRACLGMGITLRRQTYLAGMRTALSRVMKTTSNCK